MKKIIQLFEPLVRFNIQHPFWVLGASIVLAVLASIFALRLQIDTDLANLLPDSNPNVQALEQLKEVAGGETEMKVGIKSPDFQANVNFARQLADSSLALYYPRLDINYFNRAELKRETSVLKDNALYLVDPNKRISLTLPQQG
jgi:hypothetical protein